jgi:ketosteroid isomerase-like protein
MPKFDPGLVDAWVAIWNSYDLSLVEKLFLNDERVTYFSSEKQGVVKGIEALVRHHEGFGFVMGGKVQPNKLWLEDIDIEAFPGAAVVTAIWLFRRGDSGKTQRGPVTLVYVPVGGGWRIAHANFGNY